MSIKYQLDQIINNPTQVEAIMQLAFSKLTPQQKYMQSEKGKASKQKSNAKYASKQKTIDCLAAHHYLSSWLKLLESKETQYISLMDVWNQYKTNNRNFVQMLEFKAQLLQLGAPIVTDYMLELKRVHRKVYAFDTEFVKKLLD